MDKVRVAVVGLGMGGGHAKVLSGLAEVELCALCDLSQPLLEVTAKDTGCTRCYEDYQTMLSEVKPDVVVIATPNKLHEEMTLMAVEAGVKGLYCEKPIAMSLGAALKMQKACADAGIKLVIGHQRRVSAPYRAMRQLIDEGVLGEVYLIRGSCPGDFLTDGTHLVDSILYLCGDRKAKWLLSQIYQGRKATDEELAVNRFKYCGTRYGHSVEEGAMAVIEMEDGLRVELMTGTMWVPGRGYQDVEVFGTKGRLLRAGDGAKPGLKLDTGHGYKAYPFEQEDDSGLEEAHRLMAHVINQGGDHPMDIAYAIQGFELVMAVYESARIRERIDLPLKQMEFPLEIMLRDGQIE